MLLNITLHNAESVSVICLGMNEPEYRINTFGVQVIRSWNLRLFNLLCMIVIVIMQYHRAVLKLWRGFYL